MVFFKNYLLPRIPPKGTKLKPWIPPLIFNPIFRAMERVGVYFYNRAIHPSEIGLYHKLYKPKVHGPYCHWRWYGKPDTPFMDLKVSEIGAWIARRDKSIGAIYNETLRNIHYFVYKFVREPIYTNVFEGLWRILFLFMAVSWVWKLRYDTGYMYLFQNSYYHW